MVKFFSEGRETYASAFNRWNCPSSSTFATVTLAADRVIQNGLDGWVTRLMLDYVDFAKNPIPAGFFCSESAPFPGRVGFRGEPLVTGTPVALGAIDTIVQRRPMRSSTSGWVQ